MTVADDSSESRTAKTKRAMGYFFALACLIWVFHDIHPRRLLSAIQITNWWFLLSAVFFDVLTYVLQGLRWRLLLSPVGRLGTMKTTQAIYVGLFTNEVVPLRVGELIRAFLVARWLKAPIGSVVPSMVVERFLDACWLLAGIGIVAMLVPLPKDLLRAGDVLGVIVLIAAIAFVWLVVRKERELEHEPGVAHVQKKHGLLARVTNFGSEVAAGLKQIGLSRDFYVAAVVSAAMLICQGLAVWSMIVACGLGLGVLAGAVVMLVVRLGTAIPNAPANVGSFQFFTVLALGLFGVEKTTAAAFSLVDFAALTTPLWAIGLFALAKTGMSFSALKAETRVLVTTNM